MKKSILVTTAVTPAAVIVVVAINASVPNQGQHAACPHGQDLVGGVEPLVPRERLGRTEIEHQLDACGAPGTS